MTLNVYVCGQCNNEFAVKDGLEPICCPVCTELDIEWSHEVKEV